jgi:hypothetical protein
MEFEFAVKMSFRHIRDGKDKKFLPSQERIYDWVESVAPQYEKVDVVSIDREMQEVRVEYETEEPCNQFQELLLKGIRWLESDDLVTGYRLDKPTTHVRLCNVNKNVSKLVIGAFMSQYGLVSQVYRKGIRREMVEGKPGFIWDGVWQVHIKVYEGQVLPTLILAPKGNWRLKHRDSRFLCYKCGHYDHAWWACKAQPRTSADDDPEWHVGLGPHVDRIVFPNFSGCKSDVDWQMRMNAALARSKEVGRGSSRSQKPVQMSLSDPTAHPQVPASFAGVEGHTAIAEAVTKLSEAVLANANKPATAKGPSEGESMEVQDEESEQIVQAPKSQSSKTPVDLPKLNGGSITLSTQETGPPMGEGGVSQPQPPGPVVPLEYVGGSKEDLSLPENLALRSPLFGDTGSQMGNLEQSVVSLGGDQAARPWLEKPREDIVSDSSSGSESSSDESDSQDGSNHSTGSKTQDEEDIEEDVAEVEVGDNDQDNLEDSVKSGGKRKGNEEVLGDTKRIDRKSSSSGPSFQTSEWSPGLMLTPSSTPDYTPSQQAELDHAVMSITSQ